MVTTSVQNHPLYTKGQPFDIPIDQIEKSVNISPRSKRITNAQILRMARRPASEFDPILVWSRSGGSYVIVDGYHRYVVHQMQGTKSIRVRMIYGESTSYDQLHIGESNYVPSYVLIAAYSENITNGQHLLERERRTFVRTMIDRGINDLRTLTRESELHPDMIIWLASHQEQTTKVEDKDDEYHRKSIRFFEYLGRYMRYVSSIGFSTNDAEKSALLVSDLIEVLASLPPSKLNDVVKSLNMISKVVSELVDRQQRGGNSG